MVVEAPRAMILSPAEAAATRTERAVALVACPAVLFLLLISTVALNNGAPTGPDRILHHWAVEHRPDGLGAAAHLLTATGTGPLPYVVAMLAGWTACPRTARPRQEVLAALAAVATLLTGQGIRAVVTAALARPRPPLAHWAASVTGSSFPSGHATTSALAAGLLGWSAVRSGAPRPVVRTCLAVCVCVSVVTGLAPIYLGVHWPTDVLGAWLLAATWLGLTLPLLTGLVAPRHHQPEAPHDDAYAG
jgi:undecaprenyl-diphosphatase